MPTPLTPSSSQEIIPISPPPYADHKGKGKRKAVDEAATTLPRAKRFEPAPDLKRRVGETLKQQRKQEDGQYGKRKARSYEVENERQETEGMSRSRQTERMLATRGKDVNPITNSDLYSRTDHFVSASTGHQQSNRGGGSAGARTYWEVRNAKMKEQAREQKTEVLKGCVFYINGSTGPRVSNLQLQHMITANGGRFTATQNSSCTHIIASGGLSGTKTQKWINGQGSGRGGARRLKVVRVDWVLDSVEQGIRLSEAGYDVVKDPSQQNLFSAFGAVPKAELRAKGEP